MQAGWASHHMAPMGAAASVGNVLCRPPPKEMMGVEALKSDGKPPKRSKKVQAVTCQSNINAAAVGEGDCSSRAPTSTTTRICRIDGQMSSPLFSQSNSRRSRLKPTSTDWPLNLVLHLWRISLLIPPPISAHPQGAGERDSY